MTAADRAALEARYARETRNGRVLTGAHLVMLSLMLIMWSFGGKERGAWVFLACLIGFSGAGWLVWMSVLFGRLRQDLRDGQVGIAQTRLARKWYYRNWNLTLDPPLPKKNVRVSKAVYHAFEQGAPLRVRYFPASSVLARIEPAP